MPLNDASEQPRVRRSVLGWDAREDDRDCQHKLDVDVKIEKNNIDDHELYLE
jgi:hypothetical protein